MSIINWIKNNFGPEANLLRLQRDVDRKELKAKYAEAEIPLLIKKDKALEILNQRKLIQKSIRQKQFDRLIPEESRKKERFIRLKDSESEFKIKTPMDRLYKN